VNTIVNAINELYGRVADEYIELLHIIQGLAKGPQRIELFDACYRALEDHGTAESQLAALAQVRRDLSDRCPKCGEYDSCCCDLPAVEIVPEDQLPL
jgi:hypothetical protein